MKIKTKFSTLLFYSICMVFLLFQSMDMIAQVNSNDNLSPNFECTEFPSPYFVIDGRRYDSGQTAHVCRSNDILTIEAFHEDGTSFPDFTVWTGVEDYSGGEAEFNQSSVSENFEGKLVEAEYHSSEILIEAIINIVTVDVEFSMFVGQTYGFDDNDRLYYDYTYNGNDIIPEATPHKSLEINKTDKVIAKILPQGIEHEVFFKIIEDNEYTINVINQQENILTLGIVGEDIIGEKTLAASIGANDGCFSNSYLRISNYIPVQKKLVMIIAHEENDDNQLMEISQEGAPFQLCVGIGNNNFRDTNISDDEITSIGINTGPNGVCETLAQHDDIQIIEFGQKVEPFQVCIDLGSNEILDTGLSDDEVNSLGINVGQNGICETKANNTNILSSYSSGLILGNINNYLNQVYAQSVVEWEVEILEEFINFDLNRDGKLDASYIIPPDGGNVTADDLHAELQMVFSESEIPESFSQQHHFLFLYDYTNDVGDFGLAPFYGRYGFVFPKNESNEAEAYQTMLHELGHLCFGLYHPTNEPLNEILYPFTGGGDIENVMESPGGEVFRKFQWKYMQGF